MTLVVFMILTHLDPPFSYPKLLSNILVVANIWRYRYRTIGIRMSQNLRGIIDTAESSSAVSLTPNRVKLNAVVDSAVLNFFLYTNRIILHYTIS